MTARAIPATTHVPSADELPRMPLADAPFIDVGGRTDAGRVRAINTDFFVTGDLNRSFLLGPSSLPTAEGTVWAGGCQGKLLAVADGITGAGMGEYASWATVEGVTRCITNVAPWLVELGDGDAHRLVDELRRGLLNCQARVHSAAERLDHGDRPVGTTLTLAYLVWPAMLVVHVGDSRAYLLRGDRLRQLTSDDTIAQRMVDHALVAPDQAPNAPFKNVLTNAIGGDTDSIELEHHRLELERGDQVLLCSNGLTRHLDALEIKRHLRDSVTASESAWRLIDAANEAGGEDNITAVVARIGPIERPR